ncbi:FAD-dependent oxidoreductase, partial [Halomonas sp. ND22Bw]
RQYETRTILWTAGVEAVPFAEALATALGVKQVGGGRIEVEADLTVPGHPNVYVVGDLMSRDKLAGVAEVAMQGGRHAGARIAATVENGVPSR